RRLRGAQVHLDVRRRGAGGQPALRDGRGGERAGPRPPRLLRRLGLGPRVPRRHAGRAAADGRAAGRHRELAGVPGEAEEGREEGGGAAVSRAMRLAGLLPDVAGVPADLVVSGLVLDSREVRPGDAFFAIAGFGAHGLLYTAQAREKGAAAILFEPPAPADIPVPDDAIAVPGLRARMGAMADAFHGHPSRAMTMVGVTGTSGKTSTVQLVAQALTLLGTPA